MPKSYNKILLLFSFFIFIRVEAQKEDFNLRSPDGNIFFEVTLDSILREIYYKFDYKNKDVIGKSNFDIKLDNHQSEWALAISDKPEGDWMDGLVLKSSSRTSKDTIWEPVYGENSKVRNRYNQLTLNFEQRVSSNYKMEIQIRVFNAGIAFRYYFPENPTGIYYRVIEENTEFSFPENTTAWYEPWAQGPYEKRDLNGWDSPSARPLTLELENNLYVTLAEAAMLDYVRTRFTSSKDEKNTLVTSMYQPLDKITYFGTPWRVVIIGEEPGDLIENSNILLNLNEPNKIENTSWIKPGKIVREMDLSEQGGKAWIDFAAEHNLQYILYDWKWYGPAFTFDSDARTVDIDLDLKEVIRYGKEKGVGVWVYVNQQALLKQDTKIFPLYKEWGLVGVKYGFVQVGSHRWTTWLHESIARAAENELMVNIHDEFRLTGEERTWPNIMTVEGIRGNEEMPDATHNTVVPFTRGIAGMGDYTISYYDSRIKTSHAHQLALAVIMYSPLQTIFWYDKASSYNNEPEIEFFEEVPTAWDQSEVLNGEIGKYISVARRSGDEWFVGTITNNEVRTIDLNFDFLKEGKEYLATVYKDDDTVNTRTQVGLEDISVKKGSELKLNLKASGGGAIWIREK